MWNVRPYVAKVHSGAILIPGAHLTNIAYGDRFRRQFSKAAVHVHQVSHPAGSSKAITRGRRPRLRSAYLHRRPARRHTMLYTLAVILLIAWLLGMVGTYTIGAFVHLLLVVAIVLFIVGL